MDVLLIQVPIGDLDDGLRLGDFLAVQPLSFQHVQEIGVAAEIELIGAVDATPRSSNIRTSTRCVMVASDLALDVIADDRNASLLEAPPPGGVLGDEHGDAVDEADAGLERLLGVVARALARCPPAGS